MFMKIMAAVNSLTLTESNSNKKALSVLKVPFLRLI